MEGLINENLVALDLEANSKGDVIHILAGLIRKEGRLNDEAKYIEAVFAREQEFATAMGFSVAIPHGKTNAVKTPALAFARLKKEIKWSDEENVRFVFLIAVPEEAAGDYHLKILASLSRQLIHAEFCDKLAKITEPREIVGLVGEV
mgnify:CR=1 FL=1